MERDILESKVITIIGAGHMGQALVEGLLNSKEVKARNIIVSNPSKQKLSEISKKFGVKVITNNFKAVTKASLIFIAVKPNKVKEVLMEISKNVRNKIILSLAAAIDLEFINSSLGGYNNKCIRLMPNLNLAINKGIIGFKANKFVTELEKKKVISLLQKLGVVIECKLEKDFDYLTILAGCGPGLVAYLLELFEKYYLSVSIDKNQLKKMISQIFIGTLEYLNEKQLKVSSLKNSVATKGGVTETILSSLDNDNFQSFFHKSLDKGLYKLNELNENLGGEVKIKKVSI